ncbi:Actin-related protein 4A [Glycine max]|nr:Actin-related protein 4A [Glycine max]
MAMVVGAIDQMDIDGTADVDQNSGADKNKGKCKLNVGSQSLGYRRDYMEVLSPLKNGVVVDWNIVDNIWDHALRECLLVDPKERPMLLAEPCSNTQEQREFCQHGGGSTTDVPVLDGYVLQKCLDKGEYTGFSWLLPVDVVLQVRV